MAFGSPFSGTNFGGMRGADKSAFSRPANSQRPDPNGIGWAQKTGNMQHLAKLYGGAARQPNITEPFKPQYAPTPDNPYSVRDASGAIRSGQADVYGDGRRVDDGASNLQRTTGETGQDYNPWGGQPSTGVATTAPQPSAAPNSLASRMSGPPLPGVSGMSNAVTRGNGDSSQPEFPDQPANSAVPLAQPVAAYDPWGGSQSPVQQATQPSVASQQTPQQQMPVMDYNAGMGQPDTNSYGSNFIEEPVSSWQPEPVPSVNSQQPEPMPTNSPLQQGGDPNTSGPYSRQASRPYGVPNANAPLPSGWAYSRR